jgi:methylase of polypeptide subunit release factors
VFVESDAVNYVYVRTRVPTLVERRALSRDSLEKARSDAFEQIVGRRPNPNVPSLDDALLRTISYWKRSVSAELDYSVSNRDISALFNAIMFVRAVEDLYARSSGRHSDRLLSSALNNTNVSIGRLLVDTFKSIVGYDPPRDLLDASRLGTFERLRPEIGSALLADFYTNRHAPYRYDFAVMSKHALSRIYEHYVSLLRIEESPQLSLLPALPTEVEDKSRGAVYTPHFIARFFARFLQDNMPPSAFRSLRACDPACGSGMFLRTVLESQVDSTVLSSSANVSTCFDHVTGVDVDENAIEATRLSLSLLHLAATGTPPNALNLFAADALRFFSQRANYADSQDAIFANPPFVSLDTQSEEMRRSLADYLGDEGRGRSDLYQAFVKLGLECLRPGGYGLFVLPHSFLFGSAAEPVRRALAEHAWVRVLVDLSSLPVFEGTGAYVVLLIFQKQIPSAIPPHATVVRVTEQPGRALQAFLDGERKEGKAFSVYDVDQRDFAPSGWHLLPPSESRLRRRLSTLAKLEDFLEIRQGVVTGADDIFILPKAEVPKGESAMYLPLLRDRDMVAYAVPRDTDSRVFHPFVRGKLIAETELKKEFPQTWRYLLGHKSKLQSRKSLARYGKHWWEPMWPRAENIARPKIVGPHLMILPKFSTDQRGRYAVTRSTVMFARQTGTELDLLKYFTAVLNSAVCFWHVSRHSHTYRKGYVMIEPKTLRGTPVPDPSSLDQRMLREIVASVDTCLEAGRRDSHETERNLDELISEAYGLSAKEREQLGVTIES